VNRDLYIRSISIKKPQSNEYPFNLPIFQQLENLELRSKVVFLVGENGTGKSTLLEAIAVNYGFNAEGGSKNFNFSTHDSHSDLYKYLTLVKGSTKPRDGYFFRAESFYNLATQVGELEVTGYGERSLHEQSHGESFLALMFNRFWGNGLYILDEPEAALSPSRQLSLLAKMNDLVKENSQFIIATHSPILLAFPNASIYVLSENAITLTPYEQTEHYILTKQFLNNTGKYLKELFE
jgi:predicted ATPase